MSNPRIAFLVSHTHWDREWYKTYHQFRVDLVHVFKKVLDRLENDEVFKHFVMDGQTIAVKDYLEVVPEDRERIERLVQQGALTIGPWYILPDEFLVSAEATARNLLIGHEITAQFGEVRNVGYMPDSFGHLAQIPQILQGAAIDSFIYTRGNGPEVEKLGNEYIWQAPDGSEVLAINQGGGYCNASALGYQELWHAHTQREISLTRACEQIGNLFKMMEASSNSDIYLLNNGCDHFPPQAKLGEILDALRKEFPETDFRHGSFADYIDAVKKTEMHLKRWQGELLGGKRHPILSGVWSARMYLKQKNDTAQHLLSSILEPLSAYFHFCQDQEYPQGLINYSWKLLLENHPHDSICGCSTDEVHREMETRFEGVLQTADQTLQKQINELVHGFARHEPEDNKTVIAVVNPSPGSRNEVVERMVVLVPPHIDPYNLALFDQSGASIPLHIKEVKYFKRFWGVDYRMMLSHEQQNKHINSYIENFPGSVRNKAGGKTGDMEGGKQGGKDDGNGNGGEASDGYITLQFFAENLPSLGHHLYELRELKEGEQKSEPAGSVRAQKNMIENDFYKVAVHKNGTFDLFDKSTGFEYTQLGRLVDSGDCGDEYDYSPSRDGVILTSEKMAGDVSLIDSSSLSASILFTGVLILPKELDSDRQRRSSERCACRINTRFTLKHGHPVLEIDQTIDNQAKDHRLCVEFPTPIKTETIVSDGHFYINRRPIEQPRGDDWVQPPTGTYPQQDYSLLQDGEKGLAVFAKGLPEIQAVRDKAGKATLLLTLLRSVGWLSRDDFASRNKSNAGPTLYTPGAQCLGEQVFHYGVYVYAGDDLKAKVKRISQRYRTPILTKQGVMDNRRPGGGGLLRLEGNNLCISAIKKHQERESLVVRLYNLDTRASSGALIFGKKIKSVWEINLLEERIRQRTHPSTREIEIKIHPCGIQSLEIEFETP
ncbi:MAG: hypothetical protein KJ970_17280 [Candidatus Eisenbacteria bacterium]|uniref:Glycoside hydrolase family 38 central domain-containing protein n=1 Tax=Eiseniibacteriota bacterium TaxID=2212470 RepID=A0A948RZ72_UNCEI|nr:hypothetical protein [Candidatus Eisenbacteria bacterium]MBU1948518.1 hypothetical protein [Candidatus Eisenbacteria bacterium]MBU2692671.1 hypothetical protein [Candidatus Eisenbacteria bacterium]